MKIDVSQFIWIKGKLSKPNLKIFTQESHLNNIFHMLIYLSVLKYTLD